MTRALEGPLNLSIRSNVMAASESTMGDAARQAIVIGVGTAIGTGLVVAVTMLWRKYQASQQAQQNGKG